MRSCIAASEVADPARRRLLRATAALPLVAAAGGVHAGAGVEVGAPGPADAWERVAALYDVARAPVPLENGYWGLMARPVEQVYLGYLTQVSHRNGLLLPVAEIAVLARARGIDVIVDAAHGVGQAGLDVAALGADVASVNFHKWLGAPVGVGGLYIRRGCADRIDPYMGEPDPHGSVQARVHTGTVNFAAFMALPEALDLRARIDMPTRRARLQWLRNRWVDAARATGVYELLGGDDPRLHSAIAAFRLRGRASVADNQALAARLHDACGIQVVHRDGLASGACVRVTPALFNREDELDRLAAVLREIAATA